MSQLNSKKTNTSNKSSLEKRWAADNKPFVVVRKTKKRSKGDK